MKSLLPFFATMTVLVTGLDCVASPVPADQVHVIVIGEPSNDKILYRQKISIAVEGATAMGQKGLCIITSKLASKMNLDLTLVAAQIKSGKLSLSCDVDQNSIAQSLSFNASTDTKLIK